MMRRLPKYGDIVQIDWNDTHGREGMGFDDIATLDDPEPTVCFGVVLRSTKNYITIANEIGWEHSSASTMLEQIAIGTIARWKLLGRYRGKLPPLTVAGATHE